MKKTLSIIMILALAASILAGCANNEKDITSSQAQTSSVVSVESTQSEQTADPVTIKIAGMKGPTSMGMLQVMENSANGTAQGSYEFTIAGAADEITPKLIKGELDMAAVPSNLASVLYNNTKGGVKIVAINTLGVTYIVEKGDSIKSVADLKGKTIYATGKGSVPEYSLRHILKENGVDPDNDVTFEWKSEPTEVVAILNSNDNAVAMLPQPFVTAASAQVEGLKVAINLNDAWDALGSEAKLITGSMVVRTEFLNEHPETVNKFLEEYKASAEFVNSDVESAATLCEKYDIVKAPVAKKAIPFCNISYIDGAEMKTALSAFYSILFDMNDKAVGGALPADDFYYEK